MARGRSERSRGCSTPKRLMVAVFAAANAVAILTTFQYVRVMGWKDRSSGSAAAAFQPAVVDPSGLGGLYGEDEAAGGAQAPRPPPAREHDPMAQNVQGFSELRHCPCDARPHAAPMPTTLGCPQRKEDCRWTRRAGYHLPGLVDGVEDEYMLDVAQDFCMDVGPKCRGVTCLYKEHAERRTGNAGELCTLRRGAELTESPGGLEATYVKDCTNPNPNRCSDWQEPAPKPERPAAGEDLHNAAIVVLAHNRVESLTACLESLLGQKGVRRFRVFVSIDDSWAFEAMASAGVAVAERYGVDVQFWNSPKRVPEENHNEEQIEWFKFNAGKIAWHYYLVLEKTFTEQQFSHAIFIEEDLVLAPDFVSLFRSTAWLLTADESLWCVSAWNDIAFTQAVSDSCRLLRTSYFPGLGFLLRREAWLVLREQWPVAPTMGWDYWMRVAFRRAGKECVIPEVPRSRHTGEKGSSVNSRSQVRFFKAMAFSIQPDACGDEAPCHQFGDTSYLISDTYETWLDAVLTKAKANGYFKGDELKEIGVRPGRWLSDYFIVPNSVYAVNYVVEDYAALLEAAGMRPRGTKGAIPSDVRAEHHGLFKTRNHESRAHLIFVDARGPVRYGGEDPPFYDAVTAQQGEHCNAACERQMQSCDVVAMSYINNCRTMEQHYACEAGCAHQVGQELPAYVSDATRDTGLQCLVTLISPLSCKTAHPSTSRLCACV